MVLLDIVTPLIDPRIDVKGNSAHWVVRTADAALERTQIAWLALFDSQDQWAALDAGPAVVAWTPYVNPTFRSRKGRGTPAIQARMGRHFTLAWEKAVRNWNFAFRDQAEHFYTALLHAEQHYEDATRRFLGLVGLHLDNFLGAFSMHILGLCGNETLIDIPQGWTIFNTLAFPAPPIIPAPLRVAFDHALMGVLCRDVYFLLTDDTGDLPNDKLDTILSGHLGFDYAGPPTSYIHVEGSPGSYVLHTHIEGTLEHQAPRALDFHLPMPSFTETGIRSVVNGDLYAYVEPGDLLVTSGFIRLDTITGDPSQASLLLLRSDLPGAPTVLDAHPGVVFALPPLSDPATWQLVALSGTLPQPIPQVGYYGTLWFHDSAGDQSNIAHWSISGNILTTPPFTLTHTFPLLSSGYLVIDSDIFQRAIPGPVPILQLHYTWDNRFPWLFRIGVNWHITSDPGQGTTTLTPGDTVYTLDVLPPGQTWDMRILAFGALQDLIPLILAGSFWATDANGNESQHVRWRAFIFSQSS
jgi:hypothetical protein